MTIKPLKQIILIVLAVTGFTHTSNAQGNAPSGPGDGTAEPAFKRTKMPLKTNLTLAGYAAVISCLSLIASEPPITEAQADAIVQAEAQEKVTRNLARRTEFVIIDQKVVEQDSGRRLIINRVKPPARLATRPKPLPRPIAQGEELLPTKPHAMLMVSATVFDGQVTQLNWSHEGQTYTAYSNLDMNYLRGVATIETPETTYTLMMGIGNETDLSSLPNLPEFTPGELEYFVFTDDDTPLNPDSFAGIDALHSHYTQNEAALKAQRQRTDSLNTARKKYRQANPEPKDTVINIWRKK